jgi:phosphatidate cytidylyltransferase
MLIRRLLSAAWSLAVLVLFLWLGQPWFSFLVAITAFIAVYELYRLFQPELARSGRVLYLFGQVWTVLFVLSPLSGKTFVLPLLVATAVIFSLLLGFRRPDEKPSAIGEWAWNLSGIFYVGWLLSHYVMLMGLENGRVFVILVLFSTFACDTASFLVGSAVGKRKMAPTISPGKTWEGAAGGFAAAIGASFLLTAVFNLQIGYFHTLVLGMLVGVLGPLGDLSESMIKRDAGVKDTGRIMPGHGGLLDRIDSVLFVGAAAYYYIILTGI